jgi:hypothetical protein
MPVTIKRRILQKRIICILMKIILWVLSLVVFPAMSFSQQDLQIDIPQQPQLLAIGESVTATLNIQGDKLAGTCFMSLEMASSIL